jgi:hypothetical protein
MQIIDNFLTQEEHSIIHSEMMNANFPWYYANSVVSDKILSCEQKYNYQFGHSFYRDYGFCSNHTSIILPIIEKLNPVSIFRIKGILLPREEKNIEHGYHIDNPHKMKVAIYYVNTNNGYTKFSNDVKVESIANRIVIFDSSKYHTGSTCTDEKIRVAINFNYF